jgi:hypothetical protein
LNPAGAVVLSWCWRQGWLASLLAATLAYAAATVLLEAISLQTVAFFVVVILVLMVSLFLIVLAFASAITVALVAGRRLGLA